MNNKILIQNLGYNKHYKEIVDDEGFRTDYLEGYVLHGQVYEDFGTSEMVSLRVYDTQDQAMFAIEEIQDTEVYERDWLCVGSRSEIAS